MQDFSKQLSITCYIHITVEYDKIQYKICTPWPKIVPHILT